jgi:hypothetical protein
LCEMHSAKFKHHSLVKSTLQNSRVRLARQLPIFSRLANALLIQSLYRGLLLFRRNRKKKENFMLQ